MELSTLKISEIPHAMVITINRPQHFNSINHQLLQEMDYLLDTIEIREDILAVILEGQEALFCTGMDFQDNADGKKWIPLYARILRRLNEMPKISIAKVKGKVIAGGVGLVVACDLVLANNSATFQLSEALWGLLPANVLPYLIRRSSYQIAYALTLSTGILLATEAKNMQIIDYLTEHLDEKIYAILLRISYLHPKTIKAMKTYFQKLMPISHHTETLAVKTLIDLLNEPNVQQNIKNFIEFKKLPWDR